MAGCGSLIPAKFRPWGTPTVRGMERESTREARATYWWSWTGSGWLVAVGPLETVAAAGTNCDGGAPAFRGGRGWAREIQWRLGKLFEGSLGVEGRQGGGSTSDRSSPKMVAAAVWWC
jgi:hypothetical protein